MAAWTTTTLYLQQRQQQQQQQHNQQQRYSMAATAKHTDMNRHKHARLHTTAAEV
jgi:hypothetical protein